MPSPSDERGPIDLLADEFLARHKRGEKPTIKEYCARHPELADDIRDVFEALLMVEDLKPGSGDVSGALGDALQVNDQRLERVGDYQILRELGRGGMGVVYEAQQLSLGRHVALKVLASYVLLDPRQLGRFQREARAAARLHHTNIVPVYGVGEQDGLHYYVMQFIPGLGLDAVLVELQRLRRRGQPAIARKLEPGLSPNRTGAVSAVEVAQALLTGEFRPSEAADVGASTPVPRADSSATIHLPGQAEGSTLSESGRQYWQSVARIGMQVADALAYAASQGILHRDIKPSNLLLDEQGNVWVTDFGLAKADSDGDDLTRTGDIVGTLRYMAPERFSGQGDVRSDVYGLGLTLYELLTLRPAFDESDRNRLVKQVMHDEPVRPRKLNRAIPADLETVVLKAIARAPAHRYQTHGELAADLKCFVEDRPIRARRVSEAEKFWRWCNRNPLPAGLLAGMVLVFLIGFGGVFWQWRQAEAARENEQGQRQAAELARDHATAEEAKAQQAKVRAEQEEAKAKAAEERTAAALYGSNIVRAQLQYRANNITDAEDTLDHCETRRRGWEWHFLKHLCHADLMTLRGHTHWVNAVAYSPDGKLLVSAGGGNPYWMSHGAASIRPGEAIVWDAATGARRHTLRGHENLVTSVAFSPDGKTLATGSQDDTVRLWVPNSGKLLSVLPGRSTLQPWVGVSSVAFSPDGKLLAVGLHEKIDIWDMTRPLAAPLVPRSTLPGVSNLWAAGMAFSPDGLRLAVAHRKSGRGEVKVWDVARGVEPVTLAANTGMANAVAMSPDGRYLAAAQHGGGIRVWDAATGNLLQTLGGQGIDSSAGVFSPTGDRFAGSSADGVVRVWSMPGGQEINLFRGHHADVRGIAFSPDGESLASAGVDRTVKLWELAQDTEHGRLDTGDLKDITAISFADDGRRLVVAQRGGITKTLDCDSATSWKSLPTVALSQEWRFPAESACLDAEGIWLAGIDQADPSRACCWEAATGWARATLRGHRQAIAFVTINKGGARAATAGRPKQGEPERSEIKVWDAVEGRPLLQLDEANLQVTRLALSPTGDRVAVAALRVEAGGQYQKPSVKALVRIYHVDSAKVVREFVVPTKVEGAREPLQALAFSADGTRLAAAGSGRTVLLWDLSAEQPVLTDRGPDRAMDLTFSPDGRRLAIASQLQVHLLDVLSGEQVLTLLGRKHLTPDQHGFNPRVRFSPDGRQLVAICHDRVSPVALWSVDKETGRGPTARLQAARHRALATHLGLARHYSSDPSKRQAFLFHLNQLKGQELTSADEYAARGMLYQSAGQPDAAEADLARASKLAPDDPVVLFQVGSALAAGNHWHRAAPYIDRYITLGRGDPAYSCAMANVPLYLNDRVTFRRYTQQLLDRYGQSKDSMSVLNLLMWVVLMEEKAADPKLLVQMADRLLEDTRLAPPYVMQVKAMAEYRAGHLEAAVEWLRKADQRTTRPRYKAVISFFLSMAYQRLNRSDEAKAACQQGLAHMEKAFGGLDRYQPGKDEWFGWTWCQILRREAEAVLSNAKGPAQPKD